MEIIYTLPTATDVYDFVGGKVNRIIAQNPIYQQYVEDRDTIEQKRVGENVIYFRGTFSQKQAIMVSSDLNVHDEVDSSDQRVLEQYSTRLQHSKYRWEWYFSHPSAEGFGVSKFWQLSDQKHWFIKCEHCNQRQYMSWPQNIDSEKKQFICQKCKKELSDDTRRHGEWVPKYKDKDFSGYWIPLLICPWVNAAQILGYKREKSEDYFYNKVLGLPYTGGGNKLTKALLMQNLSATVNTQKGRIVIGVDTGKRLHFVCGNAEGLFYYGEASDYDEIERLMSRWPQSIVVVDQGGDLIGSRKLREKYQGRVFLCTYGTDRKGMQLVRWGEKDEDGAVMADRNRTIQLVVDEFTDRRISLQGVENDWYDYWLHWNNLTRVKEENDRGMMKNVWVRNGADHWAHATVYWRVGMDRFGFGQGSIIQAGPPEFMRESPMIEPNRTIRHNPLKQQQYALEDREPDWRST